MAPTILIQSLQSFRRRVRALTLLSGLGTVLAMAIGALLALVLVDYLLNLQAVVRIVVLVGAAGGIGWAILRYIVRPLLSRLSLTDVAGRLEEVFPQFDDRLRSTVNFISAGDVPGSGAMKQHVIDEAMTLVRTVDLNAAIEKRPALQASALALAALAVVVVLSFTAPQYLRTGLARWLMPLSGAAWPKWVQIDVLGDPPQLVPVGQQVPVKVKLSRGDRASRDVTVHYQYFTGTGANRVASGPVHEEFMSRGPDGSYTVAIDAKLAEAASAGSVVSWVTAGDDRQDLPAINIVPRLAIERVKATITPPAYAHLAARTVDLSQAPAVVAAGSTVALAVDFNKQLSAGDLLLEPMAATMKAPAIVWKSTGMSSVGTFSPEQSIRFHLRATDADGFQNPALEEYEIIVRPDQSPTVQIEQPRRSEERTAVATFALMAVAEDDFAIDGASLWVERLGDHKKWEIPLVKKAAAIGGATMKPADSSPDRRRFRIGYEWDLSKLADANLQSGDVLEYCIGVTDNYELNGKVHAPAYSGKLRITIISQQELEARVGDELRAAAAALHEAKNVQTRTTIETAHLADDTRTKPQLDPADRTAAERLTHQQESVASVARQVSGKMDDVLQRLSENKSTNTDLNNVAKDTRETLTRAADGVMQDAVRELTSARDRAVDPKNPEKSTEQRNADFKSAAGKQAQSGDQLQAALDRLGNSGSLASTIEQFRNLLAEQQKVSAETRDFARENLGKVNLQPDDQQKLDQLVSDQKKLSEMTDKAIEDANRTAGQISKSDPATAESLKAAATTAKQQQVSPSQQRASSSLKQNQQSSAQSAQKQAELGLELVIDSLRDAERRKLEDLNRKLAEMQEQVATLVRRQAGHNIDNLRLQGGDVIAKTNAEVLGDLANRAGRMLSEIKEGTEPPTTVDQLTASQVQTERNTRDPAKTAEDMPEGAATASVLTRAASRMERALVSLKDAKLAPAYEPPQVEALAALLDAKKIIDEQQQKAQEKLDQQQKDAVKARYAKIKLEQERINAETTKIEKSRDKEGKLIRPFSVSILKMPGDQGKLADETHAIEEDLAAAGGIVYVWANKDIVVSMNNVKDGLGQQRTNEEIQIEQAKIVEQLDAMIRNLSIKPPEKKFDARQGGGDGGGQGQQAARLPGEAELRLLKDLQKAINNSTKKLAEVADKPNQKLEALGGRQGDMRQLLGQLVEKASKGQMKLGPEPDNKDLLPEESTAENLDDQELIDDLLNDQPDTAELQKGVNRVGDRMARSRQRLAINHDPGKVTQLVQERILKDLDELIEEARNQQAQSQPGSGSGEGEQMADAKPGDGKGGTGKPTKQSNPSAGTGSASGGNTGGGEAAPATDIKESMAEWGKITPRLRQAAVEGASDTVIEKYKNLVDDYYRALAEKREVQ
jgi:hypothetical protein